MPSIIEFRHLRMLKSLQEIGSVSAVAKHLNLTQSAISHQIKFLEQYFDTPLFERKTKPIHFTPIGQRLLELADKVLPELEKTEREIMQSNDGDSGELRIAVECHTCFDWLMPSMDVFRLQWPKVELDIVSGFHADPVDLLSNFQADIAIVSHKEKINGIVYQPLFAHEMMGIVATDHPLAHKEYWEATDFTDETIITYPVPDMMLDLYRKLLIPNGINPKRRNSELTIAIIQLVSSHRGIAVLPYWVILPYLEKGYVAAKKVTKNGLQSKLYAALRKEHQQHYLAEFCRIVKQQSFTLLTGLEPLDN